MTALVASHLGVAVMRRVARLGGGLCAPGHGKQDRSGHRRVERHGRAVARELSRSGADVALLARGVDGLEAAAREVEVNGRRALLFPLDVADAGAVDDAAVGSSRNGERSTSGSTTRWCRSSRPQRDHGSRISPRHRGQLPRIRSWDHRGAATHATTQFGVIVQIGSGLAYRSIPLQSAYCASKAAVRGFTDSLRSELVHERSAVRVTMLQLPAVNTPQFDVVRSRLPDHPQPLPPIYQPEVIARAVLRAVLHPRREMWIGWSATKAIIGQRLIPGVLDRYLAKRAWDSQTTRRAATRSSGQTPPGQCRSSHPR